MYKKYFKRLFDIIVSFILIIILLPLFIVVSFFIKIDSKGPILFFQTRMGKDFNNFKIYKFRTMTNVKRETNSEILTNNPEVTKVGNILRRFKIDELPQIFNVFKGDVSLVGPRPILPKSKEELDDWSKVRMHIKPGLTGLAQTNGNIYIDRQERFRYDVEYVNKVSLYLDFKIMVKTVLVVLLGEERFVNKKNN